MRRENMVGKRKVTLKDKKRAADDLWALRARNAGHFSGELDPLTAKRLIRAKAKDVAASRKKRQ
jgi:hypothetical protein